MVTKSSFGLKPKIHCYPLIISIGINHRNLTKSYHDNKLYEPINLVIFPKEGFLLN